MARFSLLPLPSSGLSPAHTRATTWLRTTTFLPTIWKAASPGSGGQAPGTSPTRRRAPDGPDRGLPPTGRLSPGITFRWSSWTS